MSKSNLPPANTANNSSSISSIIKHVDHDKVVDLYPEIIMTTESRFKIKKSGYWTEDEKGNEQFIDAVTLATHDNEEKAISELLKMTEQEKEFCSTFFMDDLQKLKDDFNITL